MANPLKRTLDTSSDAEMDEPSRKRAIQNSHTSLLSHADSDSSKGPAEKKVLAPKVAGHYKIQISPLATHHTFNTSTYTLTLFHSPSFPSSPSQLYARFQFDHLSGLMRLLPEDLFNCKTEPWDAYDFISYCQLGDGDVPGRAEDRGVERWVLRWRGRDGGMRLGEKCGGESWNKVGSLRFMFDDDEPNLSSGEKEDSPESSEEKIGGDGKGQEREDNEDKVAFTVVFAYDHKLFSFRGSKIRDLEPGEIPSEEGVRELEREWHELDDPVWYVDPDAPPPVEEVEEEEETSMFDLVNTPMPERTGYQGQPWEVSGNEGEEAGDERTSPVKRVV